MTTSATHARRSRLLLLLLARGAGGSRHRLMTVTPIVEPPAQLEPLPMQEPEHIDP